MRDKRIDFLGLLLASGLALSSCSTHRGSLEDLAVKQFSGHFVTGPNQSWFRPCGAAPKDPAWWVTLTGRSVAQVKDASDVGQIVPGRSQFVVWQASMTTGGEVGPQRKGVPALLVRELLYVGVATPDDCTSGLALP